MERIEQIRRLYNKLDLLLADFYLIDLFPGVRREIDAITLLYSLARDRFDRTYGTK